MKDLESKAHELDEKAYGYRCELFKNYELKGKKIPWLKKAKLRAMKRKLGKLWYATRWNCPDRKGPAQEGLDLILSCSFANPTDVCEAAYEIEKAIWMSGEETFAETDSFGDETKAKERAEKELAVLKAEEALEKDDPDGKRKADIEFFQTVVRLANKYAVDKKKEGTNASEEKR